MYTTVDFSIQGISGLMLHNGQLADPLNDFAKKLKEVSGKRKKTDADHAEMARIEWHGGLYLDEKKRPCIPGENIEALLVAAGKKQRLGEMFKAGVLSDGTWMIEHDGPKTIEALWEDKRFRDRRGVSVGTATIMRTRPIFRNWKLNFSIQFLPELLNESQIRDAVVTAGRIIGLGDFKPKFGRFEVVK